MNRLDQTRRKRSAILRSSMLNTAAEASSQIPGTRPPRNAIAKRALGRAALFATSVLISLGMGELVTRIAFPSSRSVSWYHYDLRYGYRHRENADAATNDWGDGAEWRFRTNARGFRGPDWPDAVPAGKKRVLVMGDSFTFGNAIEEEKTYPRVAHAVVRSQGWEVLNAGTSAWGPQNVLAYLETEGASIRANCLVYGFFDGNDVVDGLVHHLYKLNGSVAERIQVSAPAPSRLATVRDAIRKLPLYDYLLEHSQLFNTVRSMGLNTLAKHDQTAPIQDLYKSVTHEQFKEALKLNEATLDRLLALARARFGAFALVMIPMRGQVVPDPDPNVVPYPVWLTQESHAHVLAWAKARSVPVIDLAESLPESPQEVATYYFKKDFHFNDEGNARLGRLLGARVPEACAKQTTDALAP